MAKERDRIFAISYVESRASLWQFEFTNVRYTMTCTINAVLMKLFFLCHHNNITCNALKKNSYPMKHIVKLIDSGVKTRCTFVDFNLNCKTHRFIK